MYVCDIDSKHNWHSLYEFACIRYNILVHEHVNVYM